jgi:hypothetical protein
MSEQERVQRAHAAQRYASSQGARALVILSVREMVVPQAFGAHDAIAIKARWGSFGVQPQLRTFIATQDQRKQWWFLSLLDEWLASLADEIATTRGEREAKP